MSLSCECDFDYDLEPGDWYYTEHNTDKDFMPLPFKRRRKCCSCGELIAVGAIATGFDRVKVPSTEVEIRIYGDDGEVPLAADWMCERCGDLYLSLSELGYCVTPRHNMLELVKEYAVMHKQGTGDND